MSENQAIIAYTTARAAYTNTPNHATAAANLAAAAALCAISDDWQSLLDEADDIMAEPA